ncbi:MAG: hypothetical protein KKC64_04085 [Spirochaetes bacterium]|nr:hypothetical protein [Spirochaetota bacterium]
MLKKFVIVSLALLLAIASATAQTVKSNSLPAGSFSIEGSDYEATAEGSGTTEAEAVNAARMSAIHVLMQALDKDRLFEELFYKNPPVTMAFSTLESSQAANKSWNAKVQIRIDSESIRILYDTTYVASVQNLLDQAETHFDQAETAAGDARSAEAQTDLARALTLYWQATDTCQAGLSLLEPISDASIFSSSGKRKASDLRQVLEATRVAAQTGYQRIQAAEASLARDEAISSSMQLLQEIEERSRSVELWIDQTSPQLDRIEGENKTALENLRSALDLRLTGLKDDESALKRLAEAIPAAMTMEQARIGIARDTLRRQQKHLQNSRNAVNREIRDPAIARAKRAQLAKQILTQKPKRYLSMRYYLPFGVDPRQDSFKIGATGIHDLEISSEVTIGANRGLWVQTSLQHREYALPAAIDPVQTWQQQAYLGFWGKGMFGFGLGWDWSRAGGGGEVDKRLSPRIIFGGFGGSPAGPTWLTSVSWELPYNTDPDLFVPDILNIGVDTSIRVAAVAELHARASIRLREIPLVPGRPLYYNSFTYGVGAGFRLPAPFLWGVEFYGSLAKPAAEAQAAWSGPVLFRMFVEYSL